MKKQNIIFLLVVLATLFVPLAYIAVIVLILKESISNKHETLSYIKDNKYLMIITISCLISIIFSKHIQISSFFGLMIFVCVITIAYVCINSKHMDKKKLLKVVYITALITYAIGIAQMLDPSYVMPKKWIDAEEYNLKKRMFSTFFNPNVFGFYINMILLTTCVNMEIKKNKAFHILERVTFILSIICLFFTFSRTSWISLVGALLCIGIVFDRKYIKYGLIIFAVIYGADVLLGINRADLTKFPTDSSLGYRFELWKTSFKIIKDNLITGIGFGTFFKYTSAYSNVITKYIEHCHNMYIQILLETGLIGFTVFVVTMISIGKRLLREYLTDKNNAFNMLVILIICMCLIHGLVDSVSLTPQIMMLLACFVGVSLSEYENFKIKQKTLKSNGYIENMF